MKSRGAVNCKAQRRRKEQLGRKEQLEKEEAVKKEGAVKKEEIVKKEEHEAGRNQKEGKSSDVEGTPARGTAFTRKEPAKQEQRLGEERRTETAHAQLRKSDSISMCPSVERRT